MVHRFHMGVGSTLLLMVMSFCVGKISWRCAKSFTRSSLPVFSAALGAALSAQDQGETNEVWETEPKSLDKAIRSVVQKSRAAHFSSPAKISNPRQKISKEKALCVQSLRKLLSSA